MPDVTLLYVSGTGHSGSTLLDRLLSEAAGFASVGELRHAWKYDFVDSELCGCGRPLSACPYWTALLRQGLGDQPRARLAEVRALQERVDRTRHLPRLALGGGARFRSDRAAYAGILSRIYHAASDVSGSPVVVETSKNLSTLLVLRSVPGVRLLNLHLVRDPRGTAASYLRQRVRPDFGERVVEEVRLGPVASSLNWCYLDVALELVATRVPTLRLRYEDLIREPRGTLDRVIEFVGAGATPDWSFLEPGGARLGREQHGIHGNVGRFGAAGRVELRVDERWRHSLPRRTRWLVTALTGPLLVRHGYPLGAGDPAGGRRAWED